MGRDMYWAAANHSKYNHLYDNETGKALCGSKARRKQYKHLQSWQDENCPRCTALVSEEEDDTCAGRYPFGWDSYETEIRP